MDTLIGSLPQNTLEEVRVHLKKFKGRDFWDIRYYSSLRTDQEKIPTGKGVLIDLRNWEELKKLVAETERQLSGRGTKNA